MKTLTKLFVIVLSIALLTTAFACQKGPEMGGTYVSNGADADRFVFTEENGYTALTEVGEADTVAAQNLIRRVFATNEIAYDTKSNKEYSITVSFNKGTFPNDNKVNFTAVTAKYKNDGDEDITYAGLVYTNLEINQGVEKYHKKVYTYQVIDPIENKYDAGTAQFGEEIDGGKSKKISETNVTYEGWYDQINTEIKEIEGKDINEVLNYSVANVANATFTIYENAAKATYGYVFNVSGTEFTTYTVSVVVDSIGNISGVNIVIQGTEFTFTADFQYCGNQIIPPYCLGEDYDF